MNAALTRSATKKSRDVMLIRDTSARLLQSQKVALADAGIADEELSISLAEETSKVEDLKNWLAWHPPSHGADIDVDTRPRHALREQEMECRARDSALTDALDAADQAIAKRMLSIEEYIRVVRSIAREQFFERLKLARARQRLGEMKGDAKRTAQRLAES